MLESAKLPNGNIPTRLGYLIASGLRVATIARIWGVAPHIVQRHRKPSPIRLSEARDFISAWEYLTELSTIARNHHTKV